MRMTAREIEFAETARPTTESVASELWLSPVDVGVLTGLKPGSWCAQCRALARMGIPFLVNGAGRPLVQRDVVLHVGREHRRRPAQPNWDAIHGA